METQIYTSLNIKQFKEILQIIDDPNDKNNKAIILKFGATWCKPCQNIKEQVHNYFKHLPNSVLCFDLDIDDEDIGELYLAYKQKQMIRSVPTIFSYVSNPERDSTHWFAPDFSVNSANPSDIEKFFIKTNTLL
tara:strand:+ start:1752 stop:2153 length:402 start_codon:yes stop_codon:yes gene_type:complete